MRVCVFSLQSRKIIYYERVSRCFAQEHICTHTHTARNVFVHTCIGMDKQAYSIDSELCRMLTFIFIPQFSFKHSLGHAHTYAYDICPHVHTHTHVYNILLVI